MDANFEIRLGIVGTGFIVDKILSAAKEESRIKVVALYSRTQEQADSFAAKHQIPYTFTSLEKMASSSLIDAVYIASPNSFHASQSILCMQYGKHVLCEKPLASNVSEARRMIAISEKYNVTLMEAMMPTMTPHFAQMMERLKDLGTIRRYFASYCQYSSRYDSLKKGLVLNAFKPELSNGAVMDIGIYTLYPLVVLFGKPTMIEAQGLKLSTGVDGQGSVNFTYKDMNATVIYSKISDSILPSEIQGENATMVIDRINYINRVEIKVRGKESEVISNIAPHNNYFYELKEFVDLITLGRRESTINSHTNSLITLEIIDEIRRQLGVVYPADLL
jgi:Predicted dehydrogenases and related proteins